MKVPEEYVGKIVGLSLVRPVHLFEYGAHTRLASSPEEQLIAAPLMKQQQTAAGAPIESPSISDLIMGALVVSTTEDSVTIQLWVPDPGAQADRGVVMQKTIANQLILSVDVVHGYDVAMPPVRREVRGAAAKSGIIL